MIEVARRAYQSRNNIYNFSHCQASIPPTSFLYFKIAVNFVGSERYV